MKEEINLLPPAVQIVRIQRLYAKRISSIYTSVIVIMLVLAAGYIGVYAALKANIQDVESSLLDGEVAGPESQTRSVNAQIGFIHDQFVEHRSFIPDVAAVLGVVPTGITISNLAVDDESRTIVISGHSSARSEIVQFEEKLHDLSWIETINAPLQNFASGPNVTFEFTITRKPDVRYE